MTLVLRFFIFIEARKRCRFLFSEDKKIPRENVIRAFGKSVLKIFFSIVFDNLNKVSGVNMILLKV